MIENEAITLQPNDAEDLAQIVEDVSPTVAEKFPENSPQRVFWDQQRAYNRLRDKHQMRWHPLVLRFALNLKYMSSSAYRAVVALPIYPQREHWQTILTGHHLIAVSK